MYDIGVIGLGKRMSSMLQRILETGKTRLAYVADVRCEEIREELSDKGFDVSKIRFFDSADEMLASCRPDGVCIGTRCSLHAALAEKVIEKNIPLFLEKPVCTSFEQLESLKGLLEKYPEACQKVTVSFPLRLTEHVKKAKEIIDSGALGTISQIQAWNNVYYGIGYYHKWYRDDSETGGQFLQKATHDFDYINYLCGFTPKSICAVSSKTVYGLTKDEPLFCRDCPEKDECPEYTPDQNKSFSPFDYCVFAKGATIEDSNSAILQYTNGVHAVYTQNFVARKMAGKRGARVIGHKATLEFDWCTDRITVFHHFEDKNDVYRVNGSGNHGGGDAVLAKIFVDTLGGAPSSCGLRDGIASAYLCLLARKSAEEHVFAQI